MRAKLCCSAALPLPAGQRDYMRTSRRRRPRCSRYAAHTKHGKAERYQRYGLVRIRALAQSASGQPEVSSPGAPRTPPHVPNLRIPERNEAPVKTRWVKRQPRPQDTVTQSLSQLLHRYNTHTREDRLALTSTQWLVLWLACNHTSSNTHLATLTYRYPTTKLKHVSNSYTSKIQLDWQQPRPRQTHLQ